MLIRLGSTGSPKNSYEWIVVLILVFIFIALAIGVIFYISTLANKV